MSRINRREGEIRAAGKSMRMLAKEQGEDLIELKRLTPHGGFEDAVMAAGLSCRQARRYMTVAKTVVDGRFDLYASISAFIGEPTQAERAKARPAITREDAEYALKINALVERGATEGEREAAQSKLDNLAQQFGRTPDQLTKEAEKLCPYQQQSAHESSQRTEVFAKLRTKTKDELLELIWTLLQRNSKQR